MPDFKSVFKYQILDSYFFTLSINRYKEVLFYHNIRIACSLICLSCFGGKRRKNLSLQIVQKEQHGIFFNILGVKYE